MARRGRVKLNQAAIDALAADPYVRERLVEGAKPVVVAAQAGAPKRTGAGAASIGAEAVFVDAGWAARISWDRAHFYMRFQEYGTKTIDARPFLRPALEGLSR